jgi:phage terminase large subunit-like protein
LQSIPRGNGKSTFRAALALWATFDPDDSGAPQVPICATTVGQAMRSIYTPALQMVRACPELDERCIAYSAIGATRLWVPSTDGEMFPIANHPDGLQGLDPSFAVVDELAFMDVDSWESLTQASGKRAASLIVGISTPSFDRENALWHIRRRVREGRDIPGFRFTEFAADDGCALDDEGQWRKANPAIDAGFLEIEALRTLLELSPESHFRIFRLGQWVEGTECWLGVDGGRVWGALEDPWPLTAGAATWVGVDASRTRDSTAVAVVQRRPDGRLHVTWRIWLPAKDQPIDPTDVMAYLRDLDRDYQLMAVAYDPRFFDVPAKMLDDEGLPMVEFPQSLERMTPAVGSTHELVRLGRLSHDGDPAATTQVLDAVPRFNDRGFTLAKGKSRGRIDAAVAMCMGVSVAQHVDVQAELQLFVA